jgi:hypothetical protein
MEKFRVTETEWLNTLSDLIRNGTKDLNTDHPKKLFLDEIEKNIKTCLSNMEHNFSFFDDLGQARGDYIPIGWRNCRHKTYILEGLFILIGYLREAQRVFGEYRYWSTISGLIAKVKVDIKMLREQKWPEISEEKALSYEPKKEEKKEKLGQSEARKEAHMLKYREHRGFLYKRRSLFADTFELLECPDHAEIANYACGTWCAAFSLLNWHKEDKYDNRHVEIRCRKGCFVKVIPKKDLIVKL